MNLKQSLEKHDFHGVWMRLLALAMILIVAVSALIASPVSANAAEVGDPSAVKGKTYAVGTDTTFAPFEYRENGKMTGIDMERSVPSPKKKDSKSPSNHWVSMQHCRL